MRKSALAPCGLLVLAVVGCSTPPARQYRVEPPPAGAWVLWGAHHDYVGDPTVLRPLESFSTKGACERHQDRLTAATEAKLDKAERETRQRVTEGAALVKNLREKRGWTQRELAERARLKEELVVKAEAGKDADFTIAAINLSQALGLGAGGLSQYTMIFPRGITTDTQCWPDTVDPRGPKDR